MSFTSKEANRLNGTFDYNKYDVEDLLFKVLVVGEFGVGKTSLIRRYTEGVFNQAYKITIGVDFSLKHIVYDNKKHITLQLWDIAGHERFGCMTRVYYKYATAAIVVYDLSRPTTLHSVLKWKADLTEKVEQQNGHPIPVVLVANKCDLEGSTINARFLTNFCQEHGFVGWFFTSAKENININESINSLVEHILTLQEENLWRSSSLSSRDLSVKRLTRAPSKKRSSCCR
ncbi:ras-related protein Rab-32B [Ixodes scapularis]|uniref:Ras-related protein Rab n=2 Tax=Ixodes TaxID=6944 RepID=A0A0K8R8E8_IXORI|nr:ras-related protein Rab-32B [Ixodes scapularis]XP_040355716.1 ras-related protein Rab-32B [Ixodes scapularis]